MAHLRLFGSPDLRGSEDQQLLSVLTQPKRLALLTYLTLASARDFHRRDTLLGIFWPESDTVRARNSLRQSLYLLRHTLGEDVILGRGDEEIAVDYGRLRCDVLDFEEAMANDDLARALDLYQGDLLEGFYISGAPEFEHWLEAERSRLSNEAIAAMMQRSRDEEARGNAAAALRWARRAVDMAPVDEALHRELVQLLGRQGNNAAALDAYRDFAVELHDVLEIEPSPETKAAIRAIINGSLGTRTPTSVHRDTGAVEITAPASEPTTSSEAATVAKPLSSLRYRRSYVLAATLFVSISLAMGIGLLGKDRGDRPEAVRTIAVLPFRSSGADEDQYFAAGLHEELVTQLSKIRALRVTARRSTVEYDHQAPDLRAIANELGVAYLVDGSVRRLGDQVKIVAYLVEMEEQQHVWARSFLHTSGHPFATQTHVAQAIADALQVRFSPEERELLSERLTASQEAYEVYLRGRIHWTRALDEREARLAERAFARAAALDANFAEAHAALSTVRLWLAWAFGRLERLPLAKEPLDRALVLKPDGVETRLAEGYYAYIANGDLDRALEILLEVIEARPSHAEAHFIIGTIQRRMGLWEEAAASMVRALELDPNSYNTAVVLGETYFRLGRFNDAERLYDRAITISPNGDLAYAEKALLWLHGWGDTIKARQVLDGAPVPFGYRYRSVPALTALIRRDYHDALDLLLASHSSESGAPRSPEDWFLVGLIYRILGRQDLARAWADSIIHSDVVENAVVTNSAVQHNLAWLHAIRASNLGLAYALAVDTLRAVKEARKAVEHLPLTGDAQSGAIVLQRLAMVYSLVDRPDDAIKTLDLLLSIPSRVTPAMVALHPVFDPLRKTPAYLELMDRYSIPQGARSRFAAPISY